MKYNDSSEQDREQLAGWVASDPIHKDAIDPSFWLPSGDPGVKCIKVEDNNGAVFYLRLENALRVYIQFPPEQEVSKMRVSSAFPERRGRRRFPRIVDREQCERRTMHRNNHPGWLDAVPDNAANFGIDANQFNRSDACLNRDLAYEPIYCPGVHSAVHCDRHVQ